MIKILVPLTGLVNSHSALAGLDWILVGWDWLRFSGPRCCDWPMMVNGRWNYDIELLPLDWSECERYPICLPYLYDNPLEYLHRCLQQNKLEQYNSICFIFISCLTPLLFSLHAHTIIIVLNWCNLSMNSQIYNTNRMYLVSTFFHVIVSFLLFFFSPFVLLQCVNLLYVNVF